MTTKSLQTFIVVVRPPSGEFIEWKMTGREVGQVILSAQELCPACDVVRIFRDELW